MARRKRSRGRRKQKQQRQAIINFALVIAAVAITGWLVWSLQPEPYDELTLCEISDELPAHTAVILDKTDEYTEEEVTFIRMAIERTRDELAVGERFTLFELDEKGEFNPRGELSLCNPGRGKQVNPLFQNPKIIEERYRAKFEGPMNEVLSDLVEPREAPASPILEAVARLGQTEAFSPEAPARKLVLISDMLQNSSLFSIYGAGRGALPANMPVSADVAKTVRDRFGNNLMDVQLEIRLIPRPGWNDVQRGELRRYWDDVFASLGIKVSWRDL
jgi:hypothetical protein